MRRSRLETGYQSQTLTFVFSGHSTFSGSPQGFGAANVMGFGSRFMIDNAVPDLVSPPVNGVFPNIPSGLVILTCWVMSSA